MLACPKNKKNELSDAVTRTFAKKLFCMTGFFNTRSMCDYFCTKICLLVFSFEGKEFINRRS